MIWQMDLILILSKTERENGRWREYQRGTSGRGQGGRVSGDTGDNAGNALKEKNDCQESENSEGQMFEMIVLLHQLT